MKASQLLRGKRAIHKVRFPRCNFRCPILPDMEELAEQRVADAAAWKAEHPDEDAADDEIYVGVRVLNGTEIANVLRDAREFAKARGVDDPREGVALYDLGVAVHTILVACMDVDAPDEPFYESAQQILDDPNLGRDGIVYLHEQQETWQDLCSPQANRIDTATFEAALDELAGPDGFSFFCQLRPGLRWIYMRSMASLLSSLQTARLQPTGPSETVGKSKASKPRPRKPSQKKVRAKSKGSKRQTARGSA